MATREPAKIDHLKQHEFVLLYATSADEQANRPDLGGAVEVQEDGHEGKSVFSIRAKGWASSGPVNFDNYAEVYRVFGSVKIGQNVIG